MSKEHLKTAEKAVRVLAKSQNGRISAREAHDAWRWVLVSLGWKQGAEDSNAKTDPNLCAFDVLPLSHREHALPLSETEDDAEQDDDHGDIERIEVSG